MNKTCYCTNCGEKHEYNREKPHFCQSCGNPINFKLRVEGENQPRIRGTRANVSMYDDYVEIPEINPNDIQIVQPPKLTFGELAKGHIPAVDRGSQLNLPTDVEVKSRSYWHDQQ